MVTPEEEAQENVISESETVIVPEYVVLFNTNESVYVLLVNPVSEIMPKAGTGAADPEQG